MRTSARTTTTVRMSSNVRALPPRFARRALRIPRAATAVLLVILGACGPSEDLHGSLAQAYPLRFDHTRARVQASGLSLEYVDRHGAVPVRITLHRDIALAAGSYDLARDGDVTGETHDGLPIPRFSRGTLHIEAIELRQGTTVVARFDVELPVDDRVLSLHGTFAGPLTELTWVSPPPTETEPPEREEGSLELEEDEGGS